MKSTNEPSQFWRKYHGYLTSVILLAAFAALLVACSNQREREQVSESTEGTEAEAVNPADDFVLDSELKEDAVPEVNELINAYYTAYSKDDLETLETLAYPMSDNEKSYIGVFSQYIKKYKNIKCYTKSGLTDGSYLVSVYYELQLYGVKTLAQGLDFFYVETDDAGKLYINNLYSPFNLSRTENALDPAVYSVIIQYGEQEDVVELSSQINSKYEESLASDVKLATMISTTIPAALKDWRESLAEETETSEQIAKADASKDAEKTEKTSEKSEKNSEKTEKTSEKSEKNSEKTEETSEKTEKNSEKTEETTEKNSEKTEETTEKTEKKKKTKVRTTDKVFVRNEPSTDADFYELADTGSIFTRVSESDGWTKVKYGDGSAYIKSDYLEEVDE